MHASVLPPGQRRVFEAVLRYFHAHGIPPRLTDLMDDLGISSQNGVNYHLQALARKGFLARADSSPRGLMPTGLLPGLAAAVERYAASAGVDLGGGHAEPA